MAAVTGTERLARAVLLFFRGGHPSENDRAVWEVMTGRSAMTAATLCEFAREVLSDERMRSQGLPPWRAWPIGPEGLAMLPRVQPIAPVRRTEPFDDPGWLFI